MEYRSLGATGLKVFPMALGTVALGVQYGIAVPGDFGRPERNVALNLIREAADQGINFFDTAPAYGDSESLLREALRGRDDCIIATKVPLPRNSDGQILSGKSLARMVGDSLEGSLRALGRETLDIVQIHNATVDVIVRGELPNLLLNAKAQGRIRFVGASVYTVAEAQAVLDSHVFDVLQVPYNLLDQRMGGVFAAAGAGGVGIIVRSAFLKGVLTAKANWLPPELAPVAHHADRAMQAMAGTWEHLPEKALRFCLSAPDVATVLVGIRTKAELYRALAASNSGGLPEADLNKARALALNDERLVNPCYWGLA